MGARETSIRKDTRRSGPDVAIVRLFDVVERSTITRSWMLLPQFIR